MTISGVNTNDLYEMQVQRKQMQQMQQTQDQQSMDQSQGMDMYIPSMQGMSMEPMASGSYDASGMEVTSANDAGMQDVMGMQPMMPPPPEMPASDSDAVNAEAETETETTATTEDDSDSTTEEVLDSISQSLRVNQDSILSTMDELGLTTDDLTDEDSLTSLVSALNEGAQKRGLTTVDDLDTTLADLLEQISSLTNDITSSDTDEASLTTEDDSQTVADDTI